MMATLPRPSVSEQAMRLAWECDARKAGLQPAAAFVRWRLAPLRPARRVILGKRRTGEAG